MNSHLTTDQQLSSLFRLLGKWRKYPNYQMERRADIFFALYLKEIIAKRMDGFIADVIIPEFPVAKGLLRKTDQDDPKQRNRSIKVDYVLFDKQSKRCVLLELKTEDLSTNDKQLENMRLAKKAKVETLIAGVIQLRARSSQKRKYDALVSELIAEGILMYDAQGISHVAEAWIDQQIDMAIIKPSKKAKQPEHVGFETISYDDVGQAIAETGKSDAITTLFLGALTDSWRG